MASFLNSLFRKKSVEHILREYEKNAAHGHSLNRRLNVRDLTAFGIAAIIGAGIFSTIGNASQSGGPAVILLFLFTAVACGFSALCYAEFASMIPISGSAYTYAYAAFGELVAWIIGWDLLIEYGIGNIAVAISWSDYFTHLMAGLGWDLPAWATMDYLSAYRGFNKVSELLASGTVFDSIEPALQQCYSAWKESPVFLGIHLVADFPALGIVVFITYLVYIGISESRTAGNIMVLIKLLIIVGVIGVGIFYINPDNWTPFAPNGFGGVMKGVAAVFFAYIGFDAVSTTAEECNNPQKDLPRGMINSLIICTVLYIAIALVLTGMVNYTELGVGDPLAFVFERVGLNWISGVIAVSAVIAMASVLLVFQMGQPRIWMSISRDGLLPPIFSKIHPKFRTPSFSTILTGFVVAIPALFMNLTEVTDLSSIGTLFAFVLVCAGVMKMHHSKDTPDRKFRTPMVSGKWIFPLLTVTGIILVIVFNSGGLLGIFNFSDITTFLSHLPIFGFLILVIYLNYLALFRRLSLIPALGLSSCFYLMTELGITNWMRFFIWLLLGLVIYFSYGFKNSKLRKAQE
jgi:amino acid transporter